MQDGFMKRLLSA